MKYIPKRAMTSRNLLLGAEPPKNAAALFRTVNKPKNLRLASGHKQGEAKDETYGRLWMKYGGLTICKII